MPSPPSAPPLRLEVRPSRRLKLLLIAGHLGGALLLFALPLPVIVQLALMLLLAISWRESRRVLLPGCFIWSGEGHWLGPAEERLELYGESFVAPFLVVVNLREGSGRERSLVLMGDSLDPDSFRRLRVRLRIEAGRVPNG